MNLMSLLNNKRLSKALLILYMSLVMLNVFLPDSFVIGIHRLPEGERLNPFIMIIRWFNFVPFVILPIATLYNRNIYNKIAVYFCLPIGIIYMCLFCEILPCLTSPNGTGIVDIRYLPAWLSSFMHNGVFRGIIFFLTCISEFALIALIICKNRQVFKFNKKDILPFIILLVCSIITIMPIYALEGIFNTYTDFIFSRFSFLHIAWILILLLECGLLTYLFKNKSEEDKYILVLVLSLSLFLQFNQLFSSLGELTCKRMPLQLCNIAAYLMLISIVNKNRKLFLFNILINVAGGIIAMIVLDAEGHNGILSKGNVHYIVEHHNVILTPLMCLFLGIFKPITNKDFKVYAIDFTAYFITILVLGTLFNAIESQVANGYFRCNYLFMFDQETATRLLPFAGKLFDIKFTVGHATFYPIIQIGVYVVFFLIGTLSFVILKNAVKEKVNENK